MKNKLLALILIFSIFFTGFDHADLDALSRAYILMDYDTGEILEEYNSESVVEIASITKLMTYLLVKEAIDIGRLRESEVLTAEKCDLRTGSKLNIKPGNQYSVEQLLEALIVISGNDAGALLARRVSGSEGEFAKLMNRRAGELGLKSATFYNATGLPIYPQNIQNTMTARDVAYLAKYIINKYPEVLVLSQVSEVIVEGEEEPAKNTNPLLGVVDSVDGLKTGSTRKAGYCLVWTSQKNNRLIGVNLGFEKMKDRDEKVKDFARYAIKDYHVRDFLEVKNSPYNLYIKEAKDPLVKIVAEESFTKYERELSKLRQDIVIYQNLKLPLRKGERVGEIIVIDELGNEVFKTYLNTSKPVEKQGIF
ncbi:MAG: D-alanyl-D-alanine carboxypeptidase [Tissierellia bacterium]|nr:D-alanyl-D-alanine carboxypeptidase [Tissierellia bacterium]